MDGQVVEEGRQEGSYGVERRESSKLSRAIPNETMEGQRGRKKSQNDFIRRRNGSGTLVALTTFAVGRVLVLVPPLSPAPAVVAPG